MKTIFETLLEEFILPEENKDKQLRIARAVLEGNAALHKLALLEKFIASTYKAHSTLVGRPQEFRWLGSEHNRFAEAANQSNKKKVSNDKYSWTHRP